MPSTTSRIHIAAVSVTFTLYNAPSNVTPRSQRTFLRPPEELSESHAVVDFQVGKDFGHGLLAAKASSVLNVGVDSRNSPLSIIRTYKLAPTSILLPGIILRLFIRAFYGTVFGHHYHQYVATAQSTRSFHGVGPSLSWNASAPFVGNPENGDLSFDLGVNAAILFGRQKPMFNTIPRRYILSAPYVYLYRREVQSSASERATCHVSRCPKPRRLRRRVFRFPTSKSVRAIAAISSSVLWTLVSTRQSPTIGFFGPFATVSIGLP